MITPVLYKFSDRKLFKEPLSGNPDQGESIVCN